MPHTECFIDGVWYPSVTTIMAVEPKPWLKAWQDKWGVLAIRKSMIAAAVGDEFHRCVESWVLIRDYTIRAPHVDHIFMPSLIPRIEGMMKSWLQWGANVNGIIHQTEFKVVSREHVYSGTLDAVGKLGRKPTIYDWKSSAKIYDEYELQLSAYAHAYNEQTGARVRDGIIVCVSKDKPNFKLTTKQFKLGKRVFGKFLKLRRKFDEMQGVPR